MLPYPSISHVPWFLFVLRWPCTIDRTSKASNYITPQLICWQIANIFGISCIETVVLSLSVVRLSRHLPQEHSGPGSAWPAVCWDGELQQQSDQPEHCRQQFRPPWSPASLWLLSWGHWRFCWWSWGHRRPVGWGHGLWIRGAIHVRCITCHDGEVATHACVCVHMHVCVCVSKLLLEYMCVSTKNNYEGLVLHLLSYSTFKSLRNGMN